MSGLPQFTPPQGPPPPPGPAFLQEALLAPAGIRMFGRSFVGLTVGELGVHPNANAPLLTLLRSLTPAARAQLQLARIYGYSYQGNYFKLAEPTVFLVYDAGIEVTPGQWPIPLGELGVEFKDEVFASQVRMWFFDQLDMGIRIDITIGWMQDILLEAERPPAVNVTGGEVTARADLVSRADLVGRADLVSRADLVGSPRRR
jgi:hypothetical protein